LREGGRKEKKIMFRGNKCDVDSRHPRRVGDISKGGRTKGLKVHCLVLNY